jgi:hypothetical protein
LVEGGKLRFVLAFFRIPDFCAAEGAIAMRAISKCRLDGAEASNTFVFPNVVKDGRVQSFGGFGNDVAVETAARAEESEHEICLATRSLCFR